MPPLSAHNVHRNRIHFRAPLFLGYLNTKSRVRKSHTRFHEHIYEYRYIHLISAALIRTPHVWRFVIVCLCGGRVLCSAWHNASIVGHPPRGTHCDVANVRQIAISIHAVNICIHVLRTTRWLNYKLRTYDDVKSSVRCNKVMPLCKSDMRILYRICWRGCLIGEAP